HDMSRTERQGQVGDLIKHSKAELQDLLLRQENILSNKRLLQSLADKGRKLQEFREKIQQALEHHEEAERRQRLEFAARTEFQSKYEQAFTMQQRPVHNTSAAGDSTQENKDSPSVEELDQALAAVTVTHKTSQNKEPETELVEALERVKLSNGSLDNKTTDNYFAKTPSVPHYLSVIEKTQKNHHQGNDMSLSGSSSPSQSSGTSSPLSVQARREWDRKHLDDITSANLPPLHYSPVQLLSLEESANLLKEQAKKQQELQAKLAAQKLSEGLKTSMGSYTPDGGPMTAYREVHDEGAQLSSEED
uniref:RNA polymerase II subunit M n=1 Tax=Neogobius melanostomus TaxID=47308 RepID=A0A8C6WVA7_9GOBI